MTSLQLCCEPLALQLRRRMPWVICRSPLRSAESDVQTQWTWFDRFRSVLCVVGRVVPVVRALTLRKGLVQSIFWCMQSLASLQSSLGMLDEALEINQQALAMEEVCGLWIRQLVVNHHWRAKVLLCHKVCCTNTVATQKHAKQMLEQQAAQESSGPDDDEDEGGSDGEEESTTTTAQAQEKGNENTSKKNTIEQPSDSGTHVEEVVQVEESATTTPALPLPVPMIQRTASPPAAAEALELPGAAAENGALFVTPCGESSRPSLVEVENAASSSFLS